MPVVTSYLNGSTAGTPPGKNDHVRAKRGVVNGWSAAAVRRHTKWLYSVDHEALNGHGEIGFALTLTLRNCPPTSDEFHRLRRAWLDRLRRMGVGRLHWVIEWQRRGVPHMHCAVYFPGDEGRDLEVLAALAIFAWTNVAEEYGALVQAQDWKGIDGPLGWSQYLSKHAARGAQHYQRQGKPEGWERTGRLWGYVGDWPVVEPSRLHMSTPAYHRYRRLVRAWRIADARRESDPEKRRSRELYARRMLACPDPKLSAVRGVSEWTPEWVTLAFVGLLENEGHRVEQEFPDA